MLKLANIDVAGRCFPLLQKVLPKMRKRSPEAAALVRLNRGSEAAAMEAFIPGGGLGFMVTLPPMCSSTQNQVHTHTLVRYIHTHIS